MTGQQLKNAILQMAVQGKLVPQDPNDEPASVLLARIRAEKEQLIREGKIKREKNPSVIFRGDDNLPYEKVGDGEPVCIADEVPFEIPESWEWVRLGNLLQVISGVSYKKDDVSNKGLRILRGGNIQNGKVVLEGTDVFLPVSYDDSDRRIKKGDIIIVASTGSKAVIGKAGYVERDMPNIMIGAFLRICRSYTHDVVSFLRFIFESQYYRNHIRELAQGTNINNIKESYITELLIALPPLAEQQRIVVKIEELQPFIEEYGRVESAVNALNASFPEALKKSILQWAVQGKLVPQDPNDEPASVLLERIHMEKEQLIKEGKIKRDKHESIIFKRDNSYYEKVGGVERCIDDELPFDIPESWEWARFGTVMLNRDSERIPLSVDERSKLRKVYDYYGASGVIDKVDCFLFDKPLLLIGEDGANLLLRNKPIAFIASGLYWVNNHAHVLDATGGLTLEYAAAYINAINLSPYVTGTAQPKMNQEKMNSIFMVHCKMK